MPAKKPEAEQTVCTQEMTSRWRLRLRSREQGWGKESSVGYTVSPSNWRCQGHECLDIRNLNVFLNCDKKKKRSNCRVKL